MAKHFSKKLKIVSVSALFAIVGLAGFIDAYFIERFAVQIEKVNMSSPKVSQPLTILQLSDIHLTRVGDYERKIIRMANDVGADVIVITGDFFSHATVFERPRSKEFISRLDQIALFVSSLKAPYGVYIIRGNNDFSDDKEVSDLFLEKMKAINIPVLADTARVIDVRGNRVALLGVDYPEFGKDQVADFWVAVDGSNHVLQSFRSEHNSYSNYFVYDHRNWKNYTYTGRMRFTETKVGAIGVTFYSRFDHGYDRFYRLRCYRGHTSFHLSPHGTKITGGQSDTGVRPEPDVWYRFRIHIQTTEAQTQIQARVWPDSVAEPARWQAIAYDDSPTRLKEGTVGVWSAKAGKHQFDDLLVISDTGDTLMSEDFENTPYGHDPDGWVDFNRDNEAIPLLARVVPDTCFTILLSHTPDYVKEAQKAGIDLVLSGHTHGGQIRLPIIGPPIKRIALGRKYMQGLHRFGRTFLYVNRGIGTIHLPLRFLCPPEITLLKISPQ